MRKNKNAEFGRFSFRSDGASFPASFFSAPEIIALHSKICYNGRCGHRHPDGREICVLPDMCFQNDAADSMIYTDDLRCNLPERKNIKRKSCGDNDEYKAIPNTLSSVFVAAVKCSTGIVCVRNGRCSGASARQIRYCNQRGMRFKQRLTDFTIRHLAGLDRAVQYRHRVNKSARRRIICRENNHGLHKSMHIPPIASFYALFI